MRQIAQDEGKLGGGVCSPLKDDEDELAGVEDAAGARISDGGGSAALRCGRARLLRAPGTKTCGSTSSVSPWRTQEARKENGGANPSPVATSSRRRRGTEAAAKVEGLPERACLQSEGKGEAGARARA
jgi:hypothetical protein